MPDVVAQHDGRDGSCPGRGSRSAGRSPRLWLLGLKGGSADEPPFGWLLPRGSSSDAGALLLALTAALSMSA